MISIQNEDFDHCQQYQLLRDSADSDGAIVTFTGLVRDFNNGSAVSMIQLEHYSGMAEKALMSICGDAKNHWQISEIRLIHRVGIIEANEQIVFIGVASKHRKEAFEACEFIIDHLKKEVPLWKKEGTMAGMKWVAQKRSDKMPVTH